MRKSSSKLWKQIGGQLIENLPQDPKMSDSDARGLSRKKNKNKYFITQSDQNNHSDPRFYKLDISVIKRGHEEEQVGEITNKAGWTESQNLENLIDQFSFIDKNSHTTLHQLKKEVSREQIQFKYHQTCKMFNSILKSLKLQISMLKNITFKELQKQKILQIKFFAQFQNLRKKLQQQFLQNKQQISENIINISELKISLKQKQAQGKKLEDQVAGNKLKIEELIQQINKTKQKYHNQIRCLNEENIKISHEKNQINRKLIELNDKITSLQQEIENKKKPEVRTPSLRFETQRSSCTPSLILNKKQQSSPKNSFQYTQKFDKLTKHPSLQNFSLTSRLFTQSIFQPMSGEQGYPEIAVSQIYGTQRSGEVEQIKQGSPRTSPRKHFGSKEKKTPYLRSSTILRDYNSKSPKLVGEKLNKIKQQIEDEIKMLKSSISTNI